jgi:hypothetical protein
MSSARFLPMLAISPTVEVALQWIGPIRPKHSSDFH